MTIMFRLTVSRALTVADVVAAFMDLMPPGLRVAVRPDGADVPDDVESLSLWAGLKPTEDQAWPLDLEVYVYEFDLGPYPDLRAAEHVAERLGVDVLCGVCPSLVDVDPRDPYYALALVGGRWHLASTAWTRLTGPYTEPVKLIRPVVVDTR